MIQEFEKQKGINIEHIDVQCFKGKRLRGELLVHLKDRADVKKQFVPCCNHGGVIVIDAEAL